jgi:arginyl-tRNA synthetase
VLLRSDGTGLYITSDLGLTVEKFERYKLDKSIWVVSSQQILHFKQLFKILELLGYKWAKNCHHLHFEHVVLPEGKMSSREGRAIMLDEVFEKLKASAYKEVDKRNPKLDERIKKEIAEKIAIAALKYNVLRIEPDDRITFDWKRMLQFEGNTGPYLQYSYVRCSSILKKAGKFRKKYEIKELNAYEKRLLRKIFQFNEIIKKSAIDLRTHYICNYAYELSSMFNEFYEKVPVLRSDEKGFRLTLVWVTGEIIKQCLNLLGIDIVERM